MGDRGRDAAAPGGELLVQLGRRVRGRALQHHGPETDTGLSQRRRHPGRR